MRWLDEARSELPLEGNCGHMGMYPDDRSGGMLGASAWCRAASKARIRSVLVGVLLSTTPLCETEPKSRSDAQSAEQG